jgi:hypothetical protein
VKQRRWRQHTNAVGARNMPPFLRDDAWRHWLAITVLIVALRKNGSSLLSALDIVERFSKFDLLIHLD